MERGHRPAVGGGRHTLADAIDLGNEPPLGLDGDVEEPIDRRRVSIRWLAATVLAAFSGAALMGGAVYAALDGEYHFARLPEFARSALRNVSERGSSVARKADRMTLLADHSSASQILRVSTTVRAGDREIVRVRPYVRVATNLALTPTSLSADVPQFNPLKLMAEEEQRGTNGPQLEPTGDLSIIMRDLLRIPSTVRIAATVRSEDVLYAVRNSILSGPYDENSPPVITASTGLGMNSSILSYAAVENDDRLAEPMPVVAENMSAIPKSAEDVTGGTNWSERTVIAKKDEGLTSLLTELNAFPQSIQEVVRAFGARGRDGGLREGLRIRVLFDTLPNGQAHPLRVSIFSELGHEDTVALNDNGRYVSVEEPREMDLADVDEEESEEGRGMRLYQSIYETALRNDIPRPMIDNLIRTFSFDVDLQRRVRPGDSFEVLYAGDEPEGHADVLFASLVFGDEERRYYLFQTPDDGIVDYYDESGKSAKKFLIRKPMSDGVFRSGFGPRRHPILGGTRMHTGVDWAAPTGTPIYAAGNGTVRKAEWDGGYGRRIEIEHLNGYVSTYSHLSGFARGIEKGTRVRQGQIIGYVGSTGLSTGPHLHYEVLINSSFVDPLRIRLPRGRELDGNILTAFERERNRIDSILERGAAMPRVAAN